MTRAEITRMVASNGSFGLFAPVGNNGKRRNGGYSAGPISVWFCGGRRPGANHPAATEPCAHLSRDKARNCPNRG